MGNLQFPFEALEENIRVDSLSGTVFDENSKSFTVVVIKDSF